MLPGQTVPFLVAEAAQSKTPSCTSTVSALPYFLELLKAEACSQLSKVQNQVANCIVQFPLRKQCVIPKEINTRNLKIMPFFNKAAGIHS